MSYRYTYKDFKKFCKEQDFHNPNGPKKIKLTTEQKNIAKKIFKMKQGGGKTTLVSLLYSYDDNCRLVSKSLCLPQRRY